jgi:hypothetical protein
MSKIGHLKSIAAKKPGVARTAIACMLLTFVFGCGDADTPPVYSGPGTGGSTGSGGASGPGGTAGMGGISGSGGMTGTGASSGTGGMVGTGGTGGSVQSTKRWSRAQRLRLYSLGVQDARRRSDQAVSAGSWRLVLQ